MNKEIFLMLLSFLFLGCPEEKKPPIIIPPTPTNCEYPPGNRNFTWRLDTVAFFPSFLGGIHAFSDSDAYLMGYIGEGKPPWRIFVGKHWDGKTWDTNIHGTDAEVGHYANDVAGDDHFMVSVGNYVIAPPGKPAIAEFDNRTKKWKSYQFQTQGELRSVWTDGKGYFIAVGDHGMVYTKDGYTSGWVYSKVPSDFNFLKIAGVSKTEIYIMGYKNLATGESFDQIWKYNGSMWQKFFDTQDSTYLLPLAKEDYVADIYPLRCSITDSLLLYVIGDNSYLFRSKGQEIPSSKINLADLGLPLKQNGRSGLDVNAYSPNDVWIFGTRYNFYHWNGNNFQKIVIPGLPNDDAHFGDQRKMFKTSTGKIFLPTEVSSQVYVVVQGTP